MLLKCEVVVNNNIICGINNFIEIATEWLIDSAHSERWRKEYWQCINALEPGSELESGKYRLMQLRQCAVYELTPSITTLAAYRIYLACYIINVNIYISSRLSPTIP